MDWVWLSYNVKLKGEYIEHQRPPMIIKLFCFKRSRLFLLRNMTVKAGDAQTRLNELAILVQASQKFDSKCGVNLSQMILRHDVANSIFSIWISWFEDLIFSCSGFPCFVFLTGRDCEERREATERPFEAEKRKQRILKKSGKLEMKYIENMFSKMFFDFWESCIYKHNRVAIVKLDTWNGMKCDQGGRLQFAPHSVLAIHLQKLLIWDL